MPQRDQPPAVTLRVNGSVGVVRLDRPKVLNAYDEDMNEALIAAFRQMESDPAVHVLLLHGAGRAFCAGADTRHTRALRGEAARRHIITDIRAKQVVAECSKPVVAAIHGWAVGGGFELALACDVRFAAPDAVFSLREVRIGTAAGSGGIQRLREIVGRGLAMDWALTGRDIDAQRAERAGLVTEIADDVFEAAFSYCQRLAELSPLALTVTKRALVPEQDVSPYSTLFHALASQALHDAADFAP